MNSVKKETNTHLTHCTLLKNESTGNKLMTPNNYMWTLLSLELHNHLYHYMYEITNNKHITTYNCTVLYPVVQDIKAIMTNYRTMIYNL